MSVGFYPRWIFANAWSEALGLGTTFLVGWALGPTLEGLHGLLSVLLVALLAVLMGVVLEGLLVGAAQAAVLRRRIPELRARVWIRATMVGAGLAWFAGMIPSSIMALNPQPTGGMASGPPPLVQYALAIGLGAVAGPILGLAQWTVLRHRVPGSGMWLVANGLAWALAMPLIFLGMDRVPWSGSPVPMIAALFAVCGLAGLVAGAVHGAVLTRLVPPEADRHADGRSE